MNKTIKKITILTVLIIILLTNSKVYAVTPTLEQIVDKFNNCSTVKQYANSNYIWKATNSENKITLSATANGSTIEYEFVLQGSILSANFSQEEALSGLMFTSLLVDCIGQLHGYSDGEMFTTMQSDKIINYTVENEGLEIKKTSDDNCQVNIDISKKIPLIDVSNEYIEVDDLQEYKKFISDGGFANLSKGNIWFNKSGDDGENTVLIAEKEKLTENTYKSLLSIIEVMFDSKKSVDYFKSNYSGISVGNKEFTGFKIEVNPVKTETEEKLIPSNSKYEFIRVTINKNLASSAINGTNNENKNTDNINNVDNTNSTNNNINNNKQENGKDNTLSVDNMPKTGVNTILPIVGILVITMLAWIVYVKYKNECK